MKIISNAKLATLIIYAVSFQASGQDSGQYLEEVIVTAQKREQSAQSIPVSVTAFSGEQLIELGITDVFDLQNTAPGLVVSHNQTATTSNFSIRGIGTGGNNFGLESSVGVYVDDIYRARQSSIINELVDVERVQVLRGPQGTLFGRNTPSGAILINSVKPDHEEGGYINANIGNLGLFTLDGALGGSIEEDVLAYRATLFTSVRDGFVDIEGKLNESDAINDKNRAGGRVQFLYTPTDSFSARLIIDYSEIDEVCCAAVTLKNNTFAVNGTPGSDYLLGLLGANIISEKRVNDYVVAYNQLPTSENKDKGVSLEMNLDAMGGTVTSITAVREFETIDSIDGDFSDAPLFSRINEAAQDSLSQEIRFAMEGERLDYVVGAYYFTQELDTHTKTSAESMFTTFLSFDPLVGQLYAGYDQLNAAIGGVLPPPANPLPAGSSARDSMKQEHDAFALFGQLDYDLNDALRATFGLRFTKEKKDLQGRFEQDNLGPAVDLGAIMTGDPRSIANMAYPGWGFAVGGPLVVLGARPDINESLDDDQVTGTAKLTWAPDDDSIYFVAYSTGYKSGGTNTDRIDPAFKTLFDAETSEAIEVGMKRDFPEQNLRLNLTLHATDTDDLQTNSFAGNGFNLTNAGEVEAKGGELEFWWYPSDTLKLSGAFVYSDVEYKNYDTANCWIATPFHTGRSDPGAAFAGASSCSRSGEPMQNNSEEVFILSVTKDVMLGDKDAYFHADYNHRSDQFHDGNNDPLKKQDGYGLLNVKAGLQLADEIEIALWVRNVADENYYVQAYDVPLQDGKINIYQGEPRTYGINIRKSF